jgi:hypothetical protein
VPPRKPREIRMFDVAGGGSNNPDEQLEGSLFRL